MRFGMRKSLKAQTILELVFVIMTLTFLFAMSFFMISLFEVSQKQTMLARTQAFIELGNYADYGYSEHGKDELGKQESQVVFVLGEDSPGTRVDLAQISSFKKMVEGELDIDVSRSVNDDPSWETFRFPRRITRLFMRKDGEDLINFPLEQTVAIAHNRSINLDQDDNVTGPTGQFSGSIHYLQVQQLNQAFAQGGVNGQGLVDNTEAIHEVLKGLAREDPSLSNEALALQENVNLADSIEGGAQAALISLALQLAMQYGFNQLSAAFKDASAEAASAGANVTNVNTNVSGTLTQGGGLAGAGGAVAGGGGFSFGFPSIELLPNAALHNFGQIMTFSSQVLNTVNLGATLAGKNIEGLGIAAAVTGGVGGMASGVSTLQSFSAAGGFDGGGLTSQFFGGLQQVSGGAGAIAGYFDPSVGQAFGIASAGLGLGAGVSSLGENWSTWSSQDGGHWQKLSGVGGVLSQGGGLASGVAPGSGVAQGLGLAGSALGTVGGAGSFAHDFKAGNYDGKVFETMAITGGLIASASGVGATVAQISGNEELAETFGYGMIGGGALALAGTVGILGKAAAEGLNNLGKKLNEKSDSGSSIESGSESPTKIESPPAPPKTDLERINEALQYASIANQITATGLSTAIAVKGAQGARESIANAPETGVGSVERVAQDLKSVDIAKVAQSMPEAQAVRFAEYMQSFQNSLAHVQERTAKGELPDREVVQKGYEASKKAQAILDAQQGLPAEGTSERAEYNQKQYQQNLQRIANANKEYSDLFQEDREVMGLMLQSERDIDGKKILVADDERQNLLEEKGNSVADRIKDHREKYYKENDYYYTRLKKAEHAWRNMDFYSPREALQQLQSAVETNEKVYHATKTALVEKLEQCGSAEGC